MDFQLGLAGTERYKSGCQITRLVTERWAALNLYCPACSSERILQERPNTKAIDFTCGACSHTYQLKAARRWSETKIVDAGYGAMLAAIRSQTRPSLVVLHYTPKWLVKELLLIPCFFLTESVIQKRKPLSDQARRAGWVGCNILLEGIPPDGKLRLIQDGVENETSHVRRQFQLVKPLEELNIAVRGWTLDVLRILRKLNKPTFNLKEVYEFEVQLASCHVHNRNIRPKIRQQLQILRDIGFIRFTKRGEYVFVH